ncbi:DNA-binding protein [Ferrimonas pelagia]|uniref:tRNA(Ile2) 2-agmatinylcytidine synthetase n=1 Tax=Ferrimonas pelagia TaxID=1177826 RepID=A0ABP9FDU7_9GAMM
MSEAPVKLYMCIDDTDILGSKGTGELAEEIAQCIEGLALGRCSGVTRHQLLVHPDIAYTSHNSSMCFEVETQTQHWGAICALAQQYLLSHAAEGSDPGLCIAPASRLADPRLKAYGEAAKQQVLNRVQAYQLAFELGLHLSEHGGEGIGVIGALAGVALRYGGFDGRCKGKLELAAGTYTVAQLLAQDGIEQVMDSQGTLLEMSEVVNLQGKLKTIWWDHQATLLVERVDGKWHNAGKPLLQAY